MTTRNREIRTALCKVETRALTDAEKSAGYIGALTGVIPYNSDSVTLRDRRLNNGQPFVERIAPKAFDGASEVMAMAGHSEATLDAFARQGVNLTIDHGENELRWTALVPNTSAGRDLLELAAKGVVRGTSFEFNVGAADTWETRSDGTRVRTVTRGTLTAVNPVVWPAYDDSSLSVSMRSSRRTSYFGSDVSYDPTASDDVAFAVESLGAEVCCLTDALEYLRENPQGAHVAYAQKEAADCADAIKQLTDWLAANGATIDAAAIARAKQLANDARSVGKQSSSPNEPQTSREQALRILHR